MTSVELDWWPLSRIGELQRFIDTVWKPGHALARDEQLLRWQHRRDDERLSVVTATDGDSLLGILGVIEVELCVRGARVPGAWLTTWVVVPAARQQRIGLRLLEFVLERFDFVGTIGGNATTTAILKALRFHSRPALLRWVLPLDADALERLSGRQLRPGKCEAPTWGGTIASWSPALAVDWDRVWEERLAPRMVGVWRDASYLEWRYLAHPRFDYEVRIALDGDGLPAALLVYRIERVRGAEATVLRLVEALGDSRALHWLADRLLEHARSPGPAFADFYCTSDRFAVGLAAAGFLREETLAGPLPSRFQPLEPLGRPLSASLRLASWTGSDDLFAADDVYFTRSDCDQDRPA